MPGDKKEPQSYGSEGDWLKGQTAQDVNRLKGAPNSQHADFYESRKDSDESRDNQGGVTSDAGADENVAHFVATKSDSDPARKVSANDTGAKRDSFFKKRDY